MYSMQSTLYCIIAGIISKSVLSSWLSHDAMQYMVDEYERNEALLAKSYPRCPGDGHIPLISEHVVMDPPMSWSRNVSNNHFTSQFKNLSDRATHYLNYPFQLSKIINDSDYNVVIRHERALVGLGAARVHACGEYIGTIDGIPNKHGTKKTNYPEYIPSILLISAEIMQKCLSSSPTVQIEHLNVFDLRRWRARHKIPEFREDRTAHQRFTLHDAYICITNKSAAFNRDPMLPFITIDGFRKESDYTCDDAPYGCAFPPVIENRPGAIFWVKSNLFDYFCSTYIARIQRAYVLVVHGDDMSVPDGQSDALAINEPQHRQSAFMEKEYKSGRLLGLHTINTWWEGVNFSLPRDHAANQRPAYLHCLPIGPNYGSHIDTYAAMMKESLQRPPMSANATSARPLLLIAFDGKTSWKPDRAKALNAIGVGVYKPKSELYYTHFTHLSHSVWLREIARHRFVLAPFGRGLDTHRIWEILLMGGIPVARRSSISSCFDDSDNTIGLSTRGSIPIVIIDSWQDISRTLLEKEWQRIMDVPIGNWDWRRGMLMSHWIDRVRNSTASVAGE